jgi:hypothetical protein
MSPSATDPISPALERTKLLLFQSPFDLNRWLVLGFALFLASLDGGNSAGFRLSNLARHGHGGTSGAASGPLAPIPSRTPTDYDCWPSPPA